MYRTVSSKSLCCIIDDKNSTGCKRQGTCNILILCYNFPMTDSSHSVLVNKAVSIVLQSHLSSADKKLLEGRVPFVAESMLQMFVQVCEEDPFSVDAIVQSLKKKLDAQGNLKKIHEVVKQERREIEDMLAVG